MMGRLKAIVAALLLVLPLTAGADEGLWLIQDLNKALEKRMRERGLRMPAKAIYDVDSGSGAADAVVSFGGRYSGAFVSDKGLLLTSGRPAVSFVGKLGDVGKDLLRDGFWAASEQHEIPVPGEKVYSLNAVYDVTADYNTLLSRLGDPDKVSDKLEKAYAEATKLPCFVHVYWAGEKVYVCAYKIYDDVRLVAVPPAPAVNPDGKDGEWSWPVSRCDFSLYRVFENGHPAKIRNSLLVSVDGYGKGSFAAAAGFPAVTRRVSSAAEYRIRSGVTRPMAGQLGLARLDILERWMSSDPSLEALYSSRASRLRESLESDSASLAAERRFGLQEKKTAKDEMIQSAVDQDQVFGGRWRGLIKRLDESYGRLAPGEVDKIRWNETLVDGTFVGSYLMRAASAADAKEASEIISSAVSETDPRVEKELLANALSEFYTNMDMRYFGHYQRWIQDRFGYDWDSAAEYLWNNSLLSKPEVTSGVESMDDLEGDSLYKFLMDSPLELSDQLDGHASKADEANAATREYLKARYWAGARSYNPEYPDGDSTLRLSFGTSDGSFSTPDILLDKTRSSSSSRWNTAVEKDFWGRWGFRVGGKRHKMTTNFRTSADFAAGMEGAPVLDSYGRLIGVVSGGSPEAVASGEAYVEGTGCVCTDIRFILWTLDRYAGQKRMVKEFVVD
ncbi:MAG: S46 family peptidase [Bacteroidales bacterium]|nr:S46 family peptidase [Bacteroidales bacterium]